MIRKTLNASRLQQEVSRRLQRVPEVVEEGVRITVPRPHPQEPDKQGCNWSMKHFGNAAGFDRPIASVLEAVQREYNLSDDARDAHAGEDNPFASFDRKSDSPD